MASTLSTVPRAKSLTPLVWHNVTNLQDNWVNYGSGQPGVAYAIDLNGVSFLVK